MIELDEKDTQCRAQQSKGTAAVALRAVLIGFSIGFSICMTACSSNDVSPLSPSLAIRARGIHPRSLYGPMSSHAPPDSALPRLRALVAATRVSAKRFVNIHEVSVNRYRDELKASGRTSRQFKINLVVKDCEEAFASVGHQREASECEALRKNGPPGQFGGNGRATAGQGLNSSKIGFIGGISSLTYAMGDSTGMTDLYPDTYYYLQDIEDYYDYQHPSPDQMADYVAYVETFAAYGIPDQMDLDAFIFSVDTWTSSLYSWGDCDSTCLANVEMPSVRAAGPLNSIEGVSHLPPTIGTTAFMTAAASGCWIDYEPLGTIYLDSDMCRQLTAIAKADGKTAIGAVAVKTGLARAAAVAITVVEWEAMALAALLASFWAAVEHA